MLYLTTLSVAQTVNATTIFSWSDWRNTRKPSGHAMYRQRLELETSRIHVRKVNAWANLFGFRFEICTWDLPLTAGPRRVVLLLWITTHLYTRICVRSDFCSWERDVTAWPPYSESSRQCSSHRPVALADRTVVAFVGYILRSVLPPIFALRLLLKSSGYEKHGVA
jgi:hypothetical protein